MLDRLHVLPLLIGLASACTPTGPEEEPVQRNATSAEEQSDDTTPDPGDHLRDVVQVESLGNASCALTSAGTVYCWGKLRAAAQPSDAPLFGRGTGVPVAVPGPEATVHGAVDRIAMLGTAIAARRTNGELWIAGEFALTGKETSRQFLPSGLSNVERILRGTDPLCWLRTDGAGQCWSVKAETLTEPRPLPAGIFIDENTATCLGTTDGVRCIGDGIGVYETAQSAVCPDVVAPPGWLPLPSPPARIVESRGHVCALTEAWSVHCTDRFQVWESTSATGTIEMVAPAVTTYEGPFVDVALEATTGICVVTPEGVVLCQGRSIRGATDIVQLSGGAAHVCGLRNDGRVMCSGINNDGQLGSGAVSDGFSAGSRSRLANFVVAPSQRQMPATRAEARRKPAGQWIPGAPRVKCGAR